MNIPRMRSFFAHGSVLLFGLTVIMLKADSAMAQSATPGPAPVPGNAVIQPPPTSNSHVKGRAIYQDSGLPAPRARVMLIDIRQPGRWPGGMYTGEQGQFHLAGVPKGEYFVVVQSTEELQPGTLSIAMPLPSGDAAFDAAWFEQYTRGYPKISIDGVNSIELEIRIPRRYGGMISGRVLRADGTPASYARVGFLRRTDKRWIVFATLPVNEQGAYRITRLPAGEYMIKAVPAAKGELTEPKGDWPGATYFISAPDAQAATPVQVLEDQETGNINITLPDRALPEVSGTLKMRQSGKPVPNVFLQLSRKQGGASNYFKSIVTDSEGRWRFSDVPDGQYTIITGHAPYRPQQDKTPDSALRFVERRQDVTVAGVDIKDLAIELSQGGIISGSVVVEGDGSRPTGVSILASVNTREGLLAASAHANRDGTFSMPGVPVGEADLSVLIIPQGQFYLKAIEANGRDLRREKLKLEEGIEARNVRIVISSGAITLAGRVLSSQSETPLGGMGVELFAADPEKRQPRRMRLIQVSDKEGRFSITGPPGDYLIVVWRIRDSLPDLGAESIEKFAANPGRIVLEPGERKTLDVHAPP